MKAVTRVVRTAIEVAHEGGQDYRVPGFTIIRDEEFLALHEAVEDYEEWFRPDEDDALQRMPEIVK